jgi:hypothetical protein
MDFKPLLYVGFRIIPFIIVSFFVLTSILKSDIRGVIFLGLLLVNCIIVVITDSIFKMNSEYRYDTPEEVKNICNNREYSVSNTANERITVMPLNINIVSFTYAYLVYLIAKYKQVNSNVHTIIFFAVLLFSMIIWETANRCAGFAFIVLSLCLGAALGVGFCEMLDYFAVKYQMKGIHFFSNITNDDDVCKVTNEEVFECSSY